MLNNIIQALPVAYFGAVAVPLIITDIREHRLPNKLTIPAIPLTLVAWVALAVLENRWAYLAVAVAVATIVAVIGLGVNRTGILGMGDVKLFTGLALMLGWFMGAYALLLPVAAVVAALAHIGVAYALRKFRMGSSLALGPHIIISAGLMLAVALA